MEPIIIINNKNLTNEPNTFSSKLNITKSVTLSHHTNEIKLGDFLSC